MDLFVVPTLSFQLLLWRADSQARPTPYVMVERDGASDGRVDRPATYRGLRLGAGAEVHPPRSRQCLWRDIQAAASRHGHS
jgi:hypothetical protein